MSGILVLQIIDKALFLLLVALPLLRSEGTAAVPIAISLCFRLIALTYPLLLFKTYA